MPIIEVENVSKTFTARHSGRYLLGRGGLSELARGGSGNKFTALEGISFTADPGTSLGIIGANGSGKSTLLKILAGVTLPSSGHVRIHGRVASLLELGAGFHPVLTGRENVYLNAGLLGMRHAQVDEVFDKIVEFSGIGDFIDDPVDTYSSGMYVRIAFAVAAFVNPDIFLVDEVLAVGDEEFQRKCRAKIAEFREQGKTILFVSHDLSIVNTLCDRVVLLSKGRMIQRPTPRETIDYYLRQIGRETGIHTMSDGRIEVLLSNGRISIFLDRREVTASHGFLSQVRCLEQWHDSSMAEWTITERGPDRCVAHGKMPRLPITFVWSLRVERQCLIWDIAVECHKEVAIDCIEANLFIPSAYADWAYGYQTGAFPEIRPSDLAWLKVVQPDVTCNTAVALPGPATSAPPLEVLINAQRPYIGLRWQNSDYVTGCRVLQAAGELPEAESVLHAGRHDLMSLEVDFGATVAEAQARIQERVRAHEAERVLDCGPLSARLEPGAVHLFHKGEELTAFVHFYTSLLVENLWNDSQNLYWGPIRRDDQRIAVSGESRRFSFRQHWELELTAEALNVAIWLEALEPLEIHEYHASIGLRAEYGRWETDHESGVFPDFDPQIKDWRHFNRTYAAGKRARALSLSLPSVTLEVTTDEAPFRMTAINTGHQHGTRVLQALRTPDTGMIRFEKGRHLYFTGRILIGNATE